MKRKLLSVLLTLVLVLSFSLVTAVPVAGANPTTIASSTMVFQSVGEYTLTQNPDGTYSGMIPMVETEPTGLGDGVAGFDLFAREGATYYVNTATLEEGTISAHDWTDWDPDTPDWYQYSLEFYEVSGIQRWRVANHSGTTAEKPWYEEDPAVPDHGVPMSGTMDWVAGYAAETDKGEYLPPINADTHPKYPHWAGNNGGGAACWDMDWSWGSEVVPLAFPGFDVQVTQAGGVFTVTLTPAAAVGILPPGPVVNERTDESYGAIQPAINSAQPNDTISVSNGIYEESLVVLTADLTLMSENGRGSTTIQNVGDAPSDQQTGIDIDADNFVLGGSEGHGFTIKGGTAGRLIQLTHGESGVQISHNEIDTTGEASIGISVGAAGAIDLNISENDFIADDGDGSIWGPDVVNVTVSNNTFTGPTTPTSGYAVQFSGVTGTSTISANDIDNYAMGVFVFGGAPGCGTTAVSGLTISGNNISGCIKGIRLGHPSQTSPVEDVTITGNTLSNTIGGQADSVAILAEEIDFIAILVNTVNNFVKGGIVVKDTLVVQIEGNIINNTNYTLAPNGIQIGPDPTPTTGTIKDNQVSGCHWEGYDPGTETYEDDWTGSGILVIAPNSALEISENEVQNNDVGMDIEAGSLTLITNNNVHDNSYGFVFWNANPTINFNDIYENSVGGVYRTLDGSLDGILDAEKNWWGAMLGPYHATTNPASTGDEVGDLVDYTPWLDAAYADGSARSYNVQNTTTSATYNWIQSAIDSAEPNETINVAAGTYDELLSIDVDGLTLLGAQANVDPRPTMSAGRSGAEESIIQKTYTTDTGAINPIKIEASNVTINGFTISPHYGDGVGDPNGINKDLIKQEPQEYNRVGTTISYNILTASGHNIVDNCDELVQLKGVTGAVIEYNYGYHEIAEESGGNAFNIADGSTDSVIRYNEAYRCGDFQYAGKWGGAIYTYESVNISVIGNKVVEGGGITFGASKATNDTAWPPMRNAGGTVEGNIVEYATFGLEIFADDVAVSGNDATGCEEYALNIIGSNVTVQGNNLCNSGTGILVEDKGEFFTSGVSINANNIYGNTLFGLENLAVAEVDATNNWWGTAIESQIAKVVSNNVDYSPWLDAAYPGGVPTSLISLKSGWNLISLPLIPDNSAIEAVLAGVVVQKVAGYSPFQDWKYYTPGFTNNLEQMNDGWGYWVDMGTTTATLTVSGYEFCEPGPAVPPSYDLVPGWNLIGFKSLRTDWEAGDYLDDLSDVMRAMYGYDTTSHIYTVIETGTELVPGKGYWLAVSAEGTIYP